MKTREEHNSYMRVYHSRRYYILREEAIKILGGKCVKCGVKNKLEIDHKNPKEKEFDCKKLLTVSKKKFLEEIKKCQLLCKKCHIEKTVLERGYKLARGTHGTLSSYRYCKCKLCKEAKTDYTREYRRKKKLLT